MAVDGSPLGGVYQKYVYIMLNKPEGVVSASRDKRDTTVVDLVAADFPRRALFPAGRLDKTSTGFVLLTDDGALAHDLLSPAHHVTKQYRVTLDTPLTEAMRAGFAAGVTLADGQRLAPAEVEPAGEDSCEVRVRLHQGGLPPDQADVWRLRGGRQCPAPGSHRRCGAGPGPGPRPMAGTDCSGAGGFAKGIKQAGGTPRCLPFVISFCVSCSPAKSPARRRAVSRCHVAGWFRVPCPKWQ